MHTLRQLKASVLGHVTDVDSMTAQLEGASVPITTDDCRACANPCDQGHDDYPARFDVDLETQMLGSVKPYHRQVVISSGKIDWPREITDVSGSLAAYLLSAQASTPTTAARHSKGASIVPGVFQSTDSSRVSILNGSLKTVSDDDACETVLLFPDFVQVTEIPKSLKGAQDLWINAVDPSVRHAGVFEGNRKNSVTRVLPYASVILLCSHKKRDNRCSIAAPKLENAFMQSFETLGWEVHTQLEHPSYDLEPSLEEFSGTLEEQETYVQDRLKSNATQEHKKVLIVKVSHFGGHKYAGNCVIYSPHGWGVWYGRLTTHHVESIVKGTIIEGKVFPSLLRGGVNLSKAGCASLNSW